MKKNYILGNSKNSIAKAVFNLNTVLAFLFILFGISSSFGQSDNCATTTLTVGATCVTTNYTIANTFTNSGVTLTCTGTSHKDGWFTFTTDATTTQINIAGTSNRNLGLGLYTGSCGSLTQVACTIPGTANASLTATVLPSTTYKLRLMRTNNVGTDNMEGTVCVYKATPSGSCTPSSTSTLDYVSNFATTGGVTNINNPSAGLSGTGYGDFYATNSKRKR